MRLDKELYRQAYRQYREWNEAELIDRARNAGKLAPEAAWQQYLALFDFARESCPPPSEWQRKRHLDDLVHYYERVQKLESWRRTYGKSQAPAPNRD
jgi:hypothetical protein